MKTKIITILTWLFYYSLHAQTAPNFNVTDTGGNVHRLYEDYLNQGTTVVIKFFFVNCPPCNSVAPAFQQKYVDWGEGQYDVQFFEITDKPTDNNNLVIGFKNNHGLTMPAISADGGAIPAVTPYKNGTFGPWYGTPTFVVIAPNGNVNYRVPFNQLDEAIEATGATGGGGGNTPQPTNVSISLSFPGSTLPAGVSVILKPNNEESPRYNITQLTNGTYNFMYPSTNFPEIQQPILTLESNLGAGSPLVNVTDLIKIQRHILGIEPLNQLQQFAGDVTGDGRVNISDIIAIQRVILLLTTVFPNGTPSYKMVDDGMPLETNPGGEVNMQLQIVKMGNVN